MMTVDYRYMQYYLNQQGTPATAYAARVLATSPLRYNKLNETSGTAIVDSSGNGYTGTYTGVDLANADSPFLPDKAPFFDGVNDYGNIYSAAFATAFNMDEFTILMFVKMANLGVWTDAYAAGRRSIVIQRDASNFIFIGRSAADNTLTFQRTANGTAKIITIGSLSYTDWFSVAISASVAGGGLLNAGDTRAYINGVQGGTTQTGSVAATGSGLSSTATVLGAGTTTPTRQHHGWLSQPLILNRPIDAAILALMIP